MAKRRRVGGAVVVGLGALAVWRLSTDEDRGRERPVRSVLNQVWIERMPRDTRDMVRQFVVFETERRRLGLAQAMSHWRVVADRFTWTLEGDLMTADFPQARRRVQLALRTWSCQGEAPAPFELCLEVTLGRQKLAFFSRSDWRIEPKGSVGLPGAFGVLTPEAPSEADPDDAAAGEQVISGRGEAALPHAWELSQD